VICRSLPLESFISFFSSSRLSFSRGGDEELDRCRLGDLTLRRRAGLRLPGCAAIALPAVTSSRRLIPLPRRWHFCPPRPSPGASSVRGARAASPPVPVPGSGSLPSPPLPLPGGGSRTPALCSEKSSAPFRSHRLTPLPLGCPLFAENPVCAVTAPRQRPRNDPLPPIPPVAGPGDPHQRPREREEGREKPLTRQRGDRTGTPAAEVRGGGREPASGEGEEEEDEEEEEGERLLSTERR